MKEIKNFMLVVSISLCLLPSVEAKEDLSAQEKAGMLFLSENMPELDKRSLKKDFLIKNVHLAYQTRGQVRWGAKIPEDIFLNDVLPYASVNEQREDWRADFHDRFLPLAQQSSSIKEAALKINTTYLNVLHVSFDAQKRPKPDQSPYESMQAHYASCTGLSILLVDALRSVGIPARIAGVALWPDKSGNHTWVEVWDGDWHYLGAGESQDFDKAWFSQKAADIDPATKESRIYATSFKRTSLEFPTAWEVEEPISAVDVTSRYARGTQFKEEKSPEALYNVAPTVLPNIRREMKTAGFWVGLHPDPDRVVLDEKGIKRLNGFIRDELKAVKNLKDLSAEYSGADLRRELDDKINDLKNKGYFLEDGRKASEDFFSEARRNSNVENVPKKIQVQYGVIVHFADQRFLPTEKELTALAGDLDFDELQNSDLDVSTPVIVLNTSADGKWMYTTADLSSGWVRSENIALCSRDEFNKFTEPKLFALATGAKVDIYLDPALREYYDYVRMGTRLMYNGHLNKTSVEVQVPTRTEDGRLKVVKGYVSGDVLTGNHLPFNARTVLTQAFKLLNEPYGWGGANGEQDCSRFLQEVFSTVGLNFPRNSKEQGQVGKLLASFHEETTDAQKLKVLREVEGGTTILPLKGHIMLYLGMFDNRPYAIHAVWAYRENNKGEDRIRVINRVAVTDLYLGEGSKKGSLLHRVNAVKVLSE